MAIELSEMKTFLRVDSEEDDKLIEQLIRTAERLCRDILRADKVQAVYGSSGGKTAVMYAVSWLYEHRSEADHRALVLTLRALLSGDRREAF